jgi:predicted nucleotidyltransferase
MRGVAELARVSPQQASLVLRRLVELGVVERRDVPPVALVRLVRENLAAQAVVAVARLRQGAIERLRSLAVEIVPSPASLVVFGSFARGEAGVRSDVDVLAVRPPALGGDDLDAWTGSLGRWADRASSALGNPVNVVEASTEEIPDLLQEGASSVWADICAEGLVIAGSSLADLAGAAWRGEHSQAPAYLEASGEEGNQAARHLRRLLPHKTRVEYDPAPIRAVDAKASENAADRMVAIAAQAVK